MPTVIAPATGGGVLGRGVVFVPQGDLFPKG